MADDHVTVTDDGLGIAVDPRLNSSGGGGSGGGRNEGNMIDDLLATMTTTNGEGEGLLDAIQATLPSDTGNPDAYSFFPGVKGPVDENSDELEVGLEHGEGEGDGDGEGDKEGDNVGGGRRGRRRKKDSVTYDQGMVKGSEEWSRLKKDNHKEVERRRRETINDGINELKKIVPGCDKNKGSILQRAVQYLLQLKENEAQNIEKWTLEKMLNEQSVKDLNAQIEGLNKTLEEREGQLRGLRERLRERDEEVSRLRKREREWGGGRDEEDVGVGVKRIRV